MLKVAFTVTLNRHWSMNAPFSECLLQIKAFGILVSFASSQLNVVQNDVFDFVGVEFEVWISGHLSSFQVYLDRLGCCGSRIVR